MKIKKITLTKHPILGDLVLDFTNKDGKAVNTVIIAGENGVGKSLILNLIYDFSHAKLATKSTPETRLFEIELSEGEISVFKTHDFTKNLFDKANLSTIGILIDFSKGNDWAQIKIGLQTPQGKWVEMQQGHIFTVDAFKKILKTIFSDVEINFTSKEIKTVTSKNIDNENILSQRSTANLATDITQLLIDIQSLDALEFTEWARDNVDKIIDANKMDSRMRRFTNAFDYMFPTKKYKSVVNHSDKKDVIFREGDKEMSIDKLSSGEKQVVFRGSFLLKDRESSKGALILIDEPEISLHPNWQLKILSYFKKLFTNMEGEQTSQIIAVTHSPFIIHNSNRSDDKVIVLKKDEHGNTVVLDEATFFGWSYEKIVEEAFDISHEITSSKPTVFLGGETDEKYFKQSAKIFHDALPFEFKWIGRNKGKGLAENTGDDAMNKAKAFFESNPQEIKNKIVLLYDSDTNKPEDGNQSLFVKRMNKNAENSVFKKGVENLLTLIPEIDVQSFYSERTKTDEYGAESVYRQLDKMKLCNYICNELNVEKQKIVLAKINDEILRMLSM